MRHAFLLGLALSAGVVTTVLLESEARACGGCFAPPENPTVVTDHRMILSISKDQTTLYDQIRYQGDPKSFAWVLPVSGIVEVGLSADTLFAALDQQTQTQINPPPLNCPQPPSDCFSRNEGASAPSADGADPGVQVTKREVVGPYETVQLKSTDANALDAWLTQNGFAVPDDVKPVVAQYVTEKFDFLALKLVPGQGVNDMRPVRVTTPGATAVLPLRMVAAGTGATVGISLWVVGEGRYEPQNFPSFYIPTEELVWDWTQSKSNYVDLRAQRTTAGAGRAWEVESSQVIYPQQVEDSVRNGWFGGSGSADPDGSVGGYAPIKDGQGVVTKTAEQVRTEDLAALFHGIPSASSRITRLRADLAHAALDADLVMTAAKDQATLSNIRQVTRELNQPQCPVFNGCDSQGTAPRDEAIARSGGGSESFACATTTRTGGNTWLAAGAGMVGIALVNAIRRRRTR